MIIEINKDVVFVDGYKNGAIYDFVSQKVYSINEDGCKIIKDYVKGKRSLKENPFKETLIGLNLVNNSFIPREWSVSFGSEMRLSVVWLEITQGCNLKCLHCYEGEQHRSCKNSLSILEIKNIISQVQNIDELILIGGEPCFNSNINEILLFASQYDLNITLFTNATLLNDDLITIIKENHIKVKVSIYGPNAIIHDSITQKKGSFEQTVSNVLKMIEKKITVLASVVAMKENEQYIDETIEFVKKIGMAVKGYDVIRNVYGGTQHEHTPTTHNILKYAFMQKPNFKTTKNDLLKNTAVNTCWYGKIAIMENGDVIPCEFERNYVYGNIRKETISDILDKDSTRDKWFLNLDKIEVCKDCEFRYACKDCRALGISVCGSLYSKNPRCLYDPYSGKWNQLV